MSLNKVMIIGRLGREPELKYTQSGSPVCTFSVATDESYTDNSGQKVEKAEWHRIVVFQKAAENCSQYLAKGSLVFIEGKLETRKWQDQQGQDRFVTEIKAQRVQFLDRKADGNGQPGGQQEGGRANATLLPYPTMKTSAPPSRPRPPAWTMFRSSKTNRIQS